MSDENLSKKQSRDRNEDPITGEPGSHPIGTGIGSASGAAAGAAVGAVGGPVGAIVGGVIGAVAGGYAGKAAGEAIDPTAEDAYWRNEHSRQPFASGSRFEDYQPAYRAGYEGYGRYGGDRAFDDVEPDLQRDYSSAGATVPWEKAREASRAAWTRVHQNRASSQASR